MTVVNTDRIEKQIVLRAPRARVWRALTDAREFAEWFGVEFTGPFVVGAPSHGVLVGTSVDAEVGRMQQAHAGLPFDITVERMEPQRLFAFRWHPFAVDRSVDYSTEPTTLVEFALEDVPEGTLLRVTESGFDRIPADRRAAAFSANEGGWTIMIGVAAKYVQGA